MDAVLRVLGAFLAIDLIAAFLLVGLVALVNRRQKKEVRESLGSFLGIAIFLAIAAGLIYGGLWLLIQAAL